MTEGVPQHIAIIMDGNGRWANRRGLPRVAGHKHGAEAARRVVTAAVEMGVGYLTLFGFSSENWSRPEAEVSELMKLLRHYLRSETAELHKNNIRLRVIGDRAGLDADIVELIEQAQAVTAGNTAMNVVIALNYGGRHDILQAARAAAESAIERGSMEEFDATFSARLMTADIPDPDLLIRTSGEKRISNFLLWQCAYAEFVFSDVLWPDFDADALRAAVAEFARRERRYGAVGQSAATNSAR